MKNRALNKVKLFKKPKIFGLSISTLLVSGCYTDSYVYGVDTFVVTEYETVTVTEYEVVDYGPSDYIQSSYNTFLAYDSTDHALNEEFSGADLVVTSYGGDDIIDTGSGDDLIYGGSGFDIIYSSYGHDDIYGEGGSDYIAAGPGDDYIDGGSGHDILYGNGGSDIIYGGSGDDTIGGDLGVDILYGEGGDDIFEIFEDDLSDLEDSMDGGTGFDTLVFYAESPYATFFLDLSQLDAENVEVIELGEYDDEISVELTIEDVIEITDDYNELIIDGDSNDEVISLDEGWEFIGEEGGSYVYAFADVTLLVDEDIPQYIT